MTRFCLGLSARGLRARTFVRHARRSLRFLTPVSANRLPREGCHRNLFMAFDCAMPEKNATPVLEACEHHGWTLRRGHTRWEHHRVSRACPGLESAVTSR